MLLVVGAGLAIGGSFAALDNWALNEPNSNYRSTTTVSGWSYRNQGAGQPVQHEAQWIGVALVVGGVLAIAAAVLLLVTLRRGRPVVGALAAVSGAVLFGVALTVGVSVLGDLGFAKATNDYTETVSPGLGFWLILAAGLLGIAAVVLALLTGGSASPGVESEPPTPPQGMPALPQPQQYPTQHPTQHPYQQPGRPPGY
ncbi:MAG TPA: hypothetical protein VG317_02335 [Pseudonocardiaceae bacterium]|nr:hypothetical protein [Pseudonocardiaceae bacterium]